MLLAAQGIGKSMRDNAWFVGFTPRRNPDIVVCTLLEAGEHGRFAGRLAAQVIEAYVNKQRRLENNLQQAKTPEPVEVGAMWTEPGDPAFHGERFPLPKPMVSAAACLDRRRGIWPVAGR